ncbi:MAG: methyltransferase domain-containing protein [Polyangiaceae bacterium]|nr:methyltransferase domain-containing protein [Polyangiaceae bacterium]
MVPRASSRIAEFVDALPLRPGMRVLEIGCGPGVAARLVCARIGSGYVLAIDRSPRAIEQARAGSQLQLTMGRLEFRTVAIEDFTLDSQTPRFDLVFAMRVGALDGRHPELETRALSSIAAALAPSGRFFIDGGSPLRELAQPFK